MTQGMTTLLSIEYLTHVRCIVRGRTAIPKKNEEILMAIGSNYISGKDHGTADKHVWWVGKRLNSKT